MQNGAEEPRRFTIFFSNANTIGFPVIFFNES